MDSENAMSPEEVLAQIKTIKQHRQWGQPYVNTSRAHSLNYPLTEFPQLAYWALVVCLIILATNGLPALIRTGWQIGAYT